MSLCLHVFMSVCLNVCMSSCLYVFMSACLYVFMPVCLYVCMSLCLYVFVSECLYICMFLYLYVFIFVCLYICMSLRLCVFMYVCLLSVCLYVSFLFSFHSKLDRLCLLAIRNAPKLTFHIQTRISKISEFLTIAVDSGEKFDEFFWSLSFKIAKKQL